MKKIAFLSCLMVGFWPHDVSAQTVPEALQQYVNNTAADFPAVLMREEVSYTEIADLVQPLQLDSLSRTSLKSYALLYAKAQKSGAEADRQAFIQQALQALDRGAGGGLAEQLIAYLQYFKRADFNAESMEKIRRLLQMGTSHFAAFIKVAGFVLQERQPFQQLLDASKGTSISNPVKEALYLALARNGDPTKLAVVQKSIRSMALGDNYIYYVVPVIIYVRQKATTDYLLELIMQDDQACTPADAEVDGQISCAYRLLEMVAPVTLDFPLQLTDGGDLDVEDYPTALREARQWIREHKQDYELRRDIY